MFLMVPPCGLACEKFQENSEFRTPFNQDARQVLVNKHVVGLGQSFASYFILCQTFSVCCYYPLKRKRFEQPVPLTIITWLTVTWLIGNVLRSLVSCYTLFFHLHYPRDSFFALFRIFFSYRWFWTIFCQLFLLFAKSFFSYLFKLPPTPTVSHSFFLTISCNL